jgi:hypothetical protein
MAPFCINLKMTCIAICECNPPPPPVEIHFMCLGNKEIYCRNQVNIHPNINSIYTTELLALTYLTSEMCVCTRI